MKGTAHIVVKDKYGKIKTDVTEHNTITDTFKNQIQVWLNDFDKWQYGPATSANRYKFPFAGQNYFNGIFLHENTIADDKDFQLPAFIGGQTSKTNTSNNIYSAASTHTADNTKIQNTWAWTADKAYSIKSLALKNEQFANAFVAVGDNTPNYNLGTVWKITDTKVYLPAENKFGELTTNMSTLSKKYITSAGFSNGGALACMPLYDNEVAVCSSSDTTINFSSSGLSAIFVLNRADVPNYSTATAKRIIKTTQFNGASEYNNGALERYRTAIIPTEHADYLLYQRSTTIFVYEIPRTSTEVTIEPVLTFTVSTTRGDSMRTYSLFGKTILWQLASGSSSSTKKCVLVRFDYDISTSQSIISYKEVEMNGTIPYDRDSSYSINKPILYNAETAWSVVNPYVMEYFFDGENPIYGMATTWHNHTILNLSTPISLAAGDVLTVSYTISVGA